MILSTVPLMDTIANVGAGTRGANGSGNARRGRRLWSEDEKRRIVAESLAPGFGIDRPATP